MGDQIPDQAPGAAANAVRQQRVGMRAACKSDAEQEWWAVAADYNGKPKVAPGRYPWREGVDLAIALLEAKFGNQNFRAVAVAADESSEDVEKRLTGSHTSALSNGGTAP